jgi:cytochrome c556
MADAVNNPEAEKDGLVGRAQAVEALSSVVALLFPAESARGQSRALPAIWTNPQDFERDLAAFQTAATHLTTVVTDAPQRVSDALGTLTGTCEACHAKFRRN